MAQMSINTGWYIGGNIGTSIANIDEAKITQNLISPTYTDDNNDIGLKIFGGYRLNEYFAIEGGFFNLGEFNYTLSTPTGVAHGGIKASGIYLDTIAFLPIQENFWAFAKVGATYTYTQDSFNSSGSLYLTESFPKKEGLNYKFGAGVEYAINDKVAVRLEVERYRVADAACNDGDIDVVSVGVTYKF